MPELPEVETIAQGLWRMFDGKEITRAVCRQTRLRYLVDPALLERACTAAKVRNILRRGKYMVWELSSRHAVIVHLGMSGRFRGVPSETPLARHEHIRFQLSDGSEVRYEDPRRFGAIVPVIGGEWRSHPLIAHLGVEPLENLDPQWLYGVAQSRKASVKQLLLDQTVIAGLGNIYASEALFEAKIHPATPPAQLTLADCKRLVVAVVATLEEAIALGGTTLEDGRFSDVEGNFGEFQTALKVYGRRGQSCLRCHAKVVSRVIGSRTSFFCPKCQKLSRGNAKGE